MNRNPEERSTQSGAGESAARAADAPDGVRVLVSLLIALAAAFALTAGITGAAVFVTGRPDWQRAWPIAMSVGLFASVFSLGPLAPGVIAGAQQAAYGYLAGSFLRMLAALGGCVVAILALKAPATPTLLMVTPVYLVQVAVEAYILGRAYWPRAAGCGHSATER